MSHQCPRNGCTRTVGDRILMCGPDWKRVAPELQRAVYAAYRRGAGVGSVSDIAKGSLKLPARLAEFRISIDTKIRDATWAVAYGLAIWGLTGDTSVPKKDVTAVLGKFFKQFLP